MPPLRRHQLICLNEAGWAALARQCPAEVPEAALTAWRHHGWPLVLCRQAPDAPEGSWSAGWPLPTRWGRRRCALRLPATGVAYLAEFPALAQVLSLQPAERRPRLARLAAQLAAAGLSARVYGSHGWQRLTGLGYLREGSDLDLWIGVADAAEADLAAQCLAQAGEAAPRLDGELVFPDGGAVSWREWARWRAGGTASVLVKDLHSVRLWQRALTDATDRTEACAA